jgi:hypothetical protein
MAGGSWRQVKEVWERRFGSWGLAYRLQPPPSSPSLTSCSLVFLSNDDLSDAGSFVWSANGTNEFSYYRVRRRINGGAWNDTYKSGSGYFNSFSWAAGDFIRGTPPPAGCVTDFEFQVKRENDQTGEQTGWVLLASFTKAWPNAIP